MNKKRVFISYSWNDKEKVIPIVNALEERGISVFLDSKDISMGADLEDFIRHNIKVSEIVIVFISRNYLNSKWSKFELSTAFKELEKRDINIIPVTLENVKLPEKLLKYQVINISNQETGLERLIEKLERYQDISFNDFDYKEFENLIYDLLKEYKFYNIDRTPITSDLGYDFKAQFKNKSPFGKIINEHWIIEAKFYRKERFSINSIQKLLVYKTALLPADLKLLLITNSQLTSLAKEYLEDYQKIENTQIEIIDGQFLKALITNRKRLLDKYFKK